MPIHFTHGDLFKSDCDLLVNPVNLKGTMGAGLAKQFKQRFPPSMYERYRRHIYMENLRIGRVAAWIVDGKGVVFLATKDDWKHPSCLGYIRDGLYGLRLYLQENPEFGSIAIPPLGCGLGGLDWADVKPLFEPALGDLPLEVFVYEP